MLVTRNLVWMLWTVLTVMGSGLVFSRNYPNKPVRLVTGEVGGDIDFIARLITPGLSGRLRQPLVVENRPGITMVELVAKSPSDGYTLLLYASPLWLLPLMRDSVSYDAARDFSPITLSTKSPIVIVVHPSLPVTSVKELIALAKAKPGELNYSTASPGSPVHLAAELFNSMAGVNIVRIHYKGSGPAVISLMGGQVHLMFATPASVTPHIKSGRLRAVAVTTAQPSDLFPGLPTVAASGLPGYEAAGNTTAMFAPAKTAPAIINRLNQEIVGVLNQTEVKARLFNNGIEIIGSSPEQVTAFMKSDVATMGKVIKEAGIRAD